MMLMRTYPPMRHVNCWSESVQCTVSLLLSVTRKAPLSIVLCFMRYLSPSLSGSNGKLVVVGSGAIFSDQYIDKEDNHKIKEVIFDFLTNDEKGDGGIKLNEIDAEDPEISDYNMIPDTCRLANAVRYIKALYMLIAPFMWFCESH